MVRSAPRLARVVAAALAAGALFAVGAAPASAADPVGYVILQGEGQCGLATVDLVTGETHELGGESLEKCVFDLEFTLDGTRLLGTRVVQSGDNPGTASLVEFDLTTGDVTTLGPLGDFGLGGPGESQGNLTFTPGGNLYTYLVPFVEAPAPGSAAVDPACDGSAFCLFQVDQADTTNLLYVNSVPQTFTVYYGLATSCAGVTSSVRDEQLQQSAPSNASWGVRAQDGRVPQVLTTVNLTSSGPGTTDVGSVGNVSIASLDYDTAGTLHAVGFDDENAGPSLYTIDTTTGAATQVTTLNDGTEPINIGVAGFAIAHPCTPPTPPAPPEPPAAQPIAAVAPRFTG
jgi:hypothetical protein